MLLERQFFIVVFLSYPLESIVLLGIKKRENDANAQVRLDKAYINEVWRLHMPSLEVLHMEIYKSDHAAILIGDVSPINISKTRKNR